MIVFSKMEHKKKGKRSKGSVAPGTKENGLGNSSFELNLDSDHNMKNNRFEYV